MASTVYETKLAAGTPCITKENVKMGTDILLGKPDKLLGSDLWRTGILSRGRVEILLAASCYKNGDKLGQL